MTTILRSIPGFSEGVRSTLAVQEEPQLGPPGVLQGIPGAIGGGVAEGFLDVTRLARLSTGAAQQFFDSTDADSNEYFDQLTKDYPLAYERVRPDPKTTGAAASFVEAATRFLTPLAVPLAGPALVAATQTTNMAFDLLEQGVPSEKIPLASAVAGGVGYAGVRLPLLGKTRLGRAAIGAGTNVGLGVAQRGATQAILGDSPAAAQFEPFKPRELLLDAAIGGITGAVLPGSKGAGFRLRPSQRDAVLAEANASSLKKPPGGFEPTSTSSDAYHQQALADGIDALAHNKPLPETRRQPTDDTLVPTERAAELHKAREEIAKDIENETGVNLLEEPRAVNAAEFEQRSRILRDANELSDRGQPVDVAVLRERHPDIPREAFDARVRELADEGVLELSRSTKQAQREQVSSTAVDGTIAPATEATETAPTIEAGPLAEAALVEPTDAVEHGGQLNDQLRLTPSEDPRLSDQSKLPSVDTLDTIQNESLDSQLADIAQSETTAAPETPLRVALDDGTEVPLSNASEQFSQRAEKLNERIALLKQIANCYTSGLA